MCRECGVSFVDENGRTRNPMQFAKGGRAVAGEGFEELYRRRNYDRGVPKKRELPRFDLFKFQAVMVGGHNVLFRFAHFHQSAAIDLCGLIDNVGEWQYNEYPAKTLFRCSPE
jgi:hypothetical protein